MKRSDGMQKIIFVLFCSLLAVGQNRAEPYDLHTYLDAVKQHSKDLQLADRDRDLAQVQKKEALSTALPTVGFEAGYNRNLTDYFTYFDMSALMPGATGLSKVPVKRDNEYNATLALRQTLFSPQVGNALKAASQYQKLSDLIYDSHFDAVITGAKKLYFQCMLLEKIWAVSKSAEINALDNFNNMKLKYDNGQVSQFELLQSEIR
jgi:outer membrane protein